MENSPENSDNSPEKSEEIPKRGRGRPKGSKDTTPRRTRIREVSPEPAKEAKPKEAAAAKEPREPKAGPASGRKGPAEPAHGLQAGLRQPRGPAGAERGGSPGLLARRDRAIPPLKEMGGALFTCLFSREARECESSCLHSIADAISGPRRCPHCHGNINSSPHGKKPPHPRHAEGSAREATTVAPSECAEG
jgi:hypothetical protein